MARGAMVEISVVIPTHNRAGLVCQVVRAFLAQEGVRFELIVVDDGSTDDTPDRVARIADARLRVLRQPNRGLAAARNAGFAQAQGRYVLFNDDDILPQPGFLAAHLAFLRRYPKSAGVSYTHIPSAVVQEGFARFWQARVEAGVRGRGDGALLGPGGFWFASLSLARTLLPNPPFAEFSGYGWEEHELGWRLWRQGVRPRLVRGAQAAHLDRVNLEAMLAKYQSMGRMAWRFYRLHPSLPVALWTGVHPLALAYKRWAYPWSKAERLLAERSWERSRSANHHYRFLLEAAYTRGLLEGLDG